MSRITDNVLEEMADWQNRPAGSCAAIFIDALVRQEAPWPRYLSRRSVRC